MGTTDLDLSILGNVPAMLRRILSKFSMNFECCLPAVVDSYDRKNNLVTIIPACNMLKTPDQPDKEPIPVQRAKMTVNALLYAGGSIGICPPLQKGDTGWILASDRDSYLFKQTRSISSPVNLDFHSYQYGVFIPDRVSGFQIQEEDESAFTLQSLDGNTRISITDGRIKHTVGGISMTITPAGIVINGPVNVNGTLTASEVVFNGVPASSHKHPGVERGGGTTDGPVA